jgi:hypothetical protein
VRGMTQERSLLLLILILLDLQWRAKKSIRSKIMITSKKATADFQRVTEHVIGSHVEGEGGVKKLRMLSRSCGIRIFKRDNCSVLIPLCGITFLTLA